MFLPRKRINREKGELDEHELAFLEHIEALEKVTYFAKLIDEKWSADDTNELEQCELLLNLHDALAEIERVKNG